MGDGYLSDQDIFADDDSQPAFCHESPKTPPTRVDSAEMSRLRGLMGGIPPPPDMTNPQINVARMLELWKTNAHLQWTGPPKPDGGTSPKKRKTFKKKKYELITNRDLKPTAGEDENGSSGSDELSEIDEPKRFDIYLNKDTEEEEILRLKVAERLVSSETSSSLMQHVILTNSAKKRQRRNGWAKSPGSRLSYLAKRRTTFSQRPGLGNSRTISILKDEKGKTSKERKSVPLKRALFQSPDKMDFSTPDCSRIKRLKLEIPSPRGVTPPRSQPLPAKQKPSVSRNLETTFNKFVPQPKPDVLNPRQKQVWQRMPLASLPS